MDKPKPEKSCKRKRPNFTQVSPHPTRTNHGAIAIAANWHFLTFLAALCWLVQAGGKPNSTVAQDILAGAKAQDGAEQPVAYYFDIALPITDAVEKSVSKRV